MRGARREVKPAGMRAAAGRNGVVIAGAEFETTGAGAGMAATGAAAGFDASEVDPSTGEPCATTEVGRSALDPVRGADADADDEWACESTEMDSAELASGAGAAAAAAAAAAA